LSHPLPAFSHLQPPFSFTHLQERSDVSVPVEFSHPIVISGNPGSESSHPIVIAPNPGGDNSGSDSEESYDTYSSAAHNELSWGIN
jgi:hypothetical protein